MCVSLAITGFNQFKAHTHAHREHAFIKCICQKPYLDEFPQPSKRIEQDVVMNRSKKIIYATLEIV